MTEKKEPVNEEIKDEEVTTEETAEEKEEVTDEKEEFKKLEAELNDKYMRLFAEFDNFKKRTQKEKTQIYTTAAAEVIEAVLPFIDNLKRAASVEVKDDEAKNVIEGIKLIERQFEEALKQIGVTEIEAVGKEFDPEKHNAVMHVDDEEIDGENIVVEEFAKGYMYRDKVVRHSTVKVAN